MEKKKQGFAVMSSEHVKAIARKGGLAVSQNREHMSEIGRKGGEKSKPKKKSIWDGIVAVGEPHVVGNLNSAHSFTEGHGI